MRNMEPILCKGCGAEILWIRTRAGKSMPVDAEPVMVLEGPAQGQERFITDEGNVITGRRARPEEERRGLPVAFVPHWATCPAAEHFRRRR